MDCLVSTVLYWKLSKWLAAEPVDTNAFPRLVNPPTVVIFFAKLEFEVPNILVIEAALDQFN